MELFDFVSVMFSIVVGLSFAQLLGGIAGLFRSSTRPSFYAPLVFWVLMLVWTHFLLWWSFWDYRDVEWNFLRFLAGSGQAVLLLFLSELVLPRKIDGPSISLEEHYLRVKPALLGTYGVLVVIFIIDGPLIFESESFWNVYRIPQIILLGSTVVGLATNRASAQWVVSLIVLLAVVFGSYFRFLPGAFA